MKILVLLALFSGYVFATPVIDDAGLIRTIQKELGKLADAGDAPTGKDLAAALKTVPEQLKVDLPEVAGRPDYGEAVESVVLLGSVDHCESKTCKRWHLRSAATAWCVGADGLFITNHHVFKAARGQDYGICTFEGRVAPVIGILAANEAADVCLFRVEGKDFKPLPLGKAAEVGDKVRVISHPERRFFMQTSGEVARYFSRPSKGGSKASEWMAITADYAKGSSGGPVLDERGAVTGMVSSTQSIYYGNRSDKDDEGPQQMVVKCCVPGAALLKLVGQ